jgi:hypothetical protein
MSTTKHTPGPWNEPVNYAGRFEVGSDRRIAIVDRIEDASLIAAAPELLGALREVEFTLAGKEDITNNGGPNDAMHLLPIVRAALAKAKGGAK